MKMYKHLLLILVTLSSLFVASLVSANDLDVSVDRTEINMSDTLNLRVTANIKMDLSFGGIMNFGRNQVEGPDLSELEKDFEVLDQSQNYSMRSINGETKSQVVWSYSLAAKRDGALTIPTLKVKDAESKEITIKVLKNNQKPSEQNPPNAFIEVTSDKSEAYVQEQIVVTVRLFTKGRISNGSLTEPESTSAIIEPFGEDKKFYRMAYQQRYDVIERQYLVFPQESGTLELPALTFNGMLIDSYSRRRLRMREQSESLELTIKPPEPENTASHWLPALSLHLEEKWDNNDNEIKVGDALTRTVSLSALGLLGSALPPLELTDSSIFKIYPDQPNVQSIQHKNGSQATRIETTTYVAINPGTYEIPEVNIKWWDTVNEVERIANLPSRTITVLPAPFNANSASNQEFGDTTDAALNTAPSTDKTVPESEENTNSSASNPASNQTTSNSTALILISALLILGWILTTFILLKKINQQAALLRRLDQQTAAKHKPATDWKVKLEQAFNNKDPKVSFYILEILNQQNSTKFLSIHDLKSGFSTLYNLLVDYEKAIYSATSENNSGATELLSKIRKELESILKQGADKPSSNYDNGLKPFYPQ